jgi:hypothetical protein
MDTKIFDSSDDEGVDLATEIPIAAKDQNATMSDMAIAAKDQNATTSDMVTNNVSTLPAALPDTNLLMICPQANDDVEMGEVVDEPSSSTTKSNKRKTPIQAMSVLPQSSKCYDATPACCSCSCREEKKGEGAATHR